MPKTTHPRRGSMQYWPRKRAKHALARVRTWAVEHKAKPLGFIGYKAGMTHIQFEDNRPKSITKGDIIAFPSTIIECPPMVAVGAAFYAKFGTGVRKVGLVLADKLNKELPRRIQVPKKAAKKMDDISVFDDVRLLVHSQPILTGIGTKAPQMIEVAVGGNSKDEKVAYIKSILGKEIALTGVFDSGNQVDVHGISTGKGFQGTVKRFGVPIRQHKAEKTKRGIGTLGPWHPNRVQFTVPQPGKMGFHLRTEYNKQIMSIGQDPAQINFSGGIPHYGIVKNTYLLLKGSVIGPKKRAVLLTQSIRPNAKVIKEVPTLKYIHREA
ncbi:MAG: large subunit ribosomal protein L3 [archaeon GW2011_AR9]|nr:large subunit ribosomal protein L3 [uncultured archaeon]KHO50222.1 MAG: large subunit ribosomal protein L3 [archaeon GW2011_AR9]MBS3120260.1 50S ribosomal protein L3 [Candidatus Woesearchaeota archaeon]HIG92957.1 50S ribosomal protein L3 [Candidatus Woesearchaeota archaeon]HIH12690.1 50S ribosomal protein L3 [Candidatus Woesearchaeota archaeon]